VSAAERVGRRRVLLALAAAAVVAATVAGSIVLLGGGGPDPPLLVARRDVGGGDPLGFRIGQERVLEAAAAQGLAHVLYVKSPGGVEASAARVARFRPLVEQAAAGSGFDADLLEAIVFLESSGRQDVIAGSDPAAAAGLTQIVAETGKDFLGMHVDLAASRRLTRAIVVARARGDARAVRRLRARRRRADERFDPAAALAGTVRYLSVARERFGRNDLAVVSYHMGIGNLEHVLRDYAGGAVGPIRDIVSADGLSWARVYFDSSPLVHADVWDELSAFGDDSETYYWRVLAAQEIMRLYRHNRPRLEELSGLQRAKASDEEVLHPARDTERFGTPGDLEHAYRRGVLLQLPARPAELHLRIDPQMGRLAPRDDRMLYRGLRPEALALLLYLADRVHTLSGTTAPLIVTSTVRDDGYQQRLVKSNPEATHHYSLHTTGYAFDILRRYRSRAQAAAFQYELERLQARNLIAWVREPTAIHVTVSSGAARLEPAMLRPARK
jgi:hypothetical protein